MVLLVSPPAPIPTLTPLKLESASEVTDTVVLMPY
jgi:hypothetical protein